MIFFSIKALEVWFQTNLCQDICFSSELQRHLLHSQVLIWREQSREAHCTHDCVCVFSPARHSFCDSAPLYHPPFPLPPSPTPLLTHCSCSCLVTTEGSKFPIVFVCTDGLVPDIYSSSGPRAPLTHMSGSVHVCRWCTKADRSL